MSLTVGTAVLFCLVGLPTLAILAVWLRHQSKRESAEAFFGEIGDRLVRAGFEAEGGGLFRREGRSLKVEVSTNPLFRREITVRMAAYSATVHEFELKRGRPVPPEFAPFAPLLARWPTCGKMFLECYAAGATADPEVSDDARTLVGLARLPFSKTCRAGAFTIREGFERDVPQWHWRHDIRPLLPEDASRFCVSYWTGSPLLNPPLVRLLAALAGKARLFWITPAADLSFLKLSFEGEPCVRRGALVELGAPEMPLAADLHTDGEFFGGLLAADDLPPGFEDERMPKVLFHEAAVRALARSVFYARRLFDDEFSWYSGEIEILSVRPLPVREALQALAGEMGAQTMEIDRRFHKRLVAPFEH
jgi:hypothetical protein